MKDLHMLVWLTQLGISVAAPLAGYILIAVWLHKSYGWGSWVILLGIVLGVSSAIAALRDALKTMDKYIRRKNAESPKSPPVSFNDHV